jgi:hypothetical protein
MNSYQKRESESPMSEKDIQRKNKENTMEFESAVKDYLEKCSDSMFKIKNRHLNPELEVRFGTNTKQSKPISKIDYDNVVKQLLQNGWTSKNMEGVQMLRITNEYLQTKEMQGEATTNQIRMSNIRTEIIGADLIQLYCQTNSIEYLKNLESMTYDKIKFTQKTRAKQSNDTPFPMVDFLDFNFRVSYQFEKEYSLNSEQEYIRKIINSWNTVRKNFRCINRVQFQHPDFPVFVDISIIKTNKHYKNKFNGKTTPIPATTIQEAGVFENEAHYEIELELANHMVEKYEFKELMVKLRQCIRSVLSGLQGTPYPISYSEQEQVIQSYMKRIYDLGHKGESSQKGGKDSGKDSDKDSGKKTDTGLEKKSEQEIPRPYFLGPSSKTLQMENVFSLDSEVDGSVIRIQENYTVTEKADGDRALLYISDKGRIYMINTNLQVLFTGTITKEKKCFNSILDGEFILYGKAPKRELLFMYAAFDIYYIGSREKEPSVRELGFCTNDPNELGSNYRLPLLQEFISLLKPESVTDAKEPCLFKIRCKHFEIHFPETNTIFNACDNIWSRKELFEYEIDGLIFTPMNTGVGGSKIGHASELRKITWDRSFKWKPPHYNTIDFLVTVKKDKDGKDEIRHLIQDTEGTEMTSSVIEYKTLILRCGFDEKKHKFVNAFNDMLYDTIGPINETETEGPGKRNSYIPVPFQPTTPYDPDAYYCYVPLTKTTTSSVHMMTLEGQPFDENMIVEFSYEKENDLKQGPWKWVPLRVRYDKTSELRAGKNNFGNDFMVANENWRSIHFPITEEIITGKTKVNETVQSESVYYNRLERDSQDTIALRDFHNLYVKRKLIEVVSHYLRDKMHIESIQLIDLAVGKAGDLPKWLNSKIGFVLGIDYSKDNIMNPSNGACVRYLNARKRDKYTKLRALFVHGNSGLNIRTDGKAFFTTLEKELVLSAFGNGQVNSTKKYAFSHGMVRDGFNITSCQFALHYFFENRTALHGFLRNVTECTKTGGYFIGTCFDGQKVYDWLRKKKEGESIRIEKNGRKMFEITKKYRNEIGEKFEADENSIGKAVYVYQESIDKTFCEYLVNFEYFCRLMENYGFLPVSTDELRYFGNTFPSANGSFDRLFSSMEKELAQNPGMQDYNYAQFMTYEEKTISFLNRYFIFKKVRHISAEMLKTIHMDELDEKKEEKKDEKKQDKKDEKKDEKKEEKKEEKKDEKKNKKIKKKITIE